INTAAKRVRTRLKKDVVKRYALQDTSILTKTSEGGLQVLSRHPLFTFTPSTLHIHTIHTSRPHHPLFTPHLITYNS
ncbi:MAG: hypothetical protein SNG73_06980, partial [Rikenellaceae bacterium]